MTARVEQTLREYQGDGFTNEAIPFREHRRGRRMPTVSAALMIEAAESWQLRLITVADG